MVATIATVAVATDEEEEKEEEERKSEWRRPNHDIHWQILPIEKKTIVGNYWQIFVDG